MKLLNIQLPMYLVAKASQKKAKFSYKRSGRKLRERHLVWVILCYSDSSRWKIIWKWYLIICLTPTRFLACTHVLYLNRKLLFAVFYCDQSHQFWIKMHGFRRGLETFFLLISKSSLSSNRFLLLNKSSRLDFKPFRCPVVLVSLEKSVTKFSIYLMTAFFNYNIIQYCTTKFPIDENSLMLIVHRRLLCFDIGRIVDGQQLNISFSKLKSRKKSNAIR